VELLIYNLFIAFLAHALARRDSLEMVLKKIHAIVQELFLIITETPPVIKQVLFVICSRKQCCFVFIPCSIILDLGAKKTCSTNFLGFQNFGVMFQEPPALS